MSNRPPPFRCLPKFSCPSSAGLKINLFTLNENAYCHESPRRARKKFQALGLFCSASPSPPGAEVAVHQQFGNRKVRSLKTLPPPATAAATTK
jgi:hypothetical protein